MGYNIKTLTSDLVSRGMADGGLVAWGQSGNGWLFGAMAAIAPMHAISKQGDKILITPFSNSQIKYESCIAIDRASIESAKVSGGLFGGKLTLVLRNGETRKYAITQGKDAVKEILSILGL